MNRSDAQRPSGAIVDIVFASLARIGGSREDESGRTRAIVAGSLILLVGFFTLFVLTYTGEQLFGFPAALAGVFGLFLAGLIVGWHVLLARSDAAGGRKTLVTIVGVSGALLIGALCTASALLYAFADDISLLMAPLRVEQVDATPRLAELPALRTQRDELRKTIADPAVRAVSDDPDVKNLQVQLANADAANKMQRLRMADQEVHGGRPTPDDLILRDQLDREASNVRDSLSAREAAVSDSIRVEDVYRSASARADLRFVQWEIDTREADQASLEQRARQENDGPAPRLPSVEVLTRIGNPALVLVAILSYLVFSMLLLAPALVNMLGRGTSGRGRYAGGQY